MKRRTYGTGNLTQTGKSKWQIQYRENGKRKTETIQCRTKREAENILHERVENPSIYPMEVGSKQCQTQPLLATLFDLHLAGLRRKNTKDRANVEKKMHKHLYPRFGDLPISAFTNTTAALYIDERLKSGAARSTINRECSMLRGAFKAGKRAGLVKELPEIEHLSETGNRRRGFFEYENYLTMLALLPHHQQMLLCFACHTGVRKGELLSLKWDWLDWHTMLFRVPGEFCKNGEDHIIPVYGPMVEFLNAAYSERNPECSYVFQYRGKRLTNIRTGWEKACKEAGAKYLFHDLRRTAARFMEKALIPRSVAKSIGGWLTDEMWNRYLITAENDAIETGTVMEAFFKRLKEKTQISSDLAVTNESAQKFSQARMEGKLLN